MTHGRQMFLDDIGKYRTGPAERLPSRLRILNWNIGNPSRERGMRQVNWVAAANPDIITLTEAKSSEGCVYIRERLESLGYDVFFPGALQTEYCVIVASKGMPVREWKLKIDFLAHRVISIVCDTYLGEISFIGVYVPSRGPREKRNLNKIKFQDQMIELLKDLSKTSRINNLLVGGDLNVVESNHVPHYSVFGEWEYDFYRSFAKTGLVDAYRLRHPDTHEYSWFGKKGDGYRFDHFFISRELSRYIVRCSYIHTPRIRKLSDHSAMYLELAKASQD